MMHISFYKFVYIKIWSKKRQMLLVQYAIDPWDK